MAEALTLKKLKKEIDELKEIIQDMRNPSTQFLKINVDIGGNFELAGVKWTVLDITEKGYICFADRIDEDGVKFNSTPCNNWETSDLRECLKEFERKVISEYGDVLVPFERDLITLDGLYDYGTCEDKVSIISFDEYRKYRHLIPKTNYYYWTLTADSTANNLITVVCPSGDIDNRDCDGDGGVRPFCIFSSSIFESEI